MNSRLILADAHVHLYACFDIGQLLDSASKNFQKEADNIVPGALFTAFLFLAETKTESWFQHLYLQAHEGPSLPGRAGQWTFQLTEEDCSLYVLSNKEEQRDLFIIAGRQIKAANDLEVLALGTREIFKEAQPIKEIIQTIGNNGTIPVVPWGAGKWIGARGRMIKDLLNDKDLPPFFLGDTRNRPVFWPKSSIFSQASAKGLKTLPGSDPLPLPSHGIHPGSYGFQLRGGIDPAYPLKSFKSLLFNPGADPVPYGRRQGIFCFLWDQFCLRAKAGK